MKNLFLALSILAVISLSCTHDKGVVIGGKGGSATVTLYPRHHGRTSNLDSLVVYVKYNSLDAPASGIYDDSMTCQRADTLFYASFPGLKNGSYYFFSHGYDYSISQRVKGGMPYVISVQGSQNTDLPVSEE
jgi:hypothetical protein